MATRSVIRFLRAGRLVELGDVSPTDTVLDYLRCREIATGTKEGCCEGDCGACTVAIGTPANGVMRYAPANSCIQLLGTLDGKELVTVEDLSPPGQPLHPVQRAMVDCHGSQCGFCTPGFVMSLFVLHQGGGQPAREVINTALAGNLCRCTGYKPIIAAARQSLEHPPVGPASLAGEVPQDDADIFIGDAQRFFASPASLTSLLGLYDQHRDALPVAGATDVGLWITKQMRDLQKVIYLGRVAELNTLVETDSTLTLGAGVTYEAAGPALAGLHTDVAMVVNRIGSKQVRALGTIGGNIANGSPIGDMPPMLIALAARLTLRSKNGTRQMPLEDYFIDYGKQRREPGEIVEKIEIPRLAANEYFYAHKLSKRFDQDISAVMAAMRMTVHDGIVAGARLAFGGMAGIPKRATRSEAALSGLAITDTESWQQAADVLAQDFQPLSDMRASADYRLTAAKAMLLKARAQFAGGNNIRITGGADVA